MSSVYSKKKRACRWNDTPGPLYNAAPTHLLFGSTPHYTTLFSNVKPPGMPGNLPGGPGNLIWGFVLCFLAVGVLGVYKNHARVGCQLRIRGGRGACYRKVRPLAHPDLIVIYFILLYLSVLLHTILLLVLCHQFPGCVYRLMRYFHVLYVF